MAAIRNRRSRPCCIRWVTSRHRYHFPMPLPSASDAAAQDPQSSRSDDLSGACVPAQPGSLGELFWAFSILALQGFGA